MSLATTMRSPRREFRPTRDACYPGIPGGLSTLVPAPLWRTNNEDDDAHTCRVHKGAVKKKIAPTATKKNFFSFFFVAVGAIFSSPPPCLTGLLKATAPQGLAANVPPHSTLVYVDAMPRTKHSCHFSRGPVPFVLGQTSYHPLGLRWKLGWAATSSFGGKWLASSLNVLGHPTRHKRLSLPCSLSTLNFTVRGTRKLHGDYNLPHIFRVFLHRKQLKLRVLQLFRAAT